MKNDKLYLLVIFAMPKDINNFVKIISNEISSFVTSRINYCYSNENMFFSFKSDEETIEINYFFDELLNLSNIPYLITVVNDNMSVSIDDELQFHLFDTLIDSNNDMEQDLGDILDDVFESNNDYLNYNEIEDELSCDEILTKISKYGITSLSDNEKKLLNKYSKTI